MERGYRRWQGVKKGRDWEEEGRDEGRQRGEEEGREGG